MVAGRSPVGRRGAPQIRQRRSRRPLEWTILRPLKIVEDDGTIIDVGAVSRAIVIDTIKTEWLPRCRAEMERLTEETADVRREIPLSDAKWRAAIERAVEKRCVAIWGPKVDDDVLADVLFPNVSDRIAARRRVQKIRQRLA